MLTIPISDDGAVILSYIDSGPPEASEAYTTLVCFHGGTFNSHIFQRLANAAPKFNLRVIAPDRRGFGESTPFSSNEDKFLHGEAAQKFLRERVREIGIFLLHLVDTLRIPKVTSDGQRGGLAILGWSAGNTSAVSFFGIEDALDDESRHALDPYFRCLILWDPHPLSIGIDVPDHKFDQRDSFEQYLACHFEHSRPQLLHGEEVNLEGRRAIDLEERSPRKNTPSIFSSMSPEDLERSHSSSAPVELHLVMTLPREDLWQITQRALFDTTLFPHVKVVHLYGLESVWECVWASWCVDQAARRTAEPKRPFRTISIPGANHFAHWEEPDRFIEFCISALRE